MERLFARLEAACVAQRRSAAEKIVALLCSSSSNTSVASPHVKELYSVRPLECCERVLLEGAPEDTALRVAIVHVLCALCLVTEAGGLRPFAKGAALLLGAAVGDTHMSVRLASCVLLPYAVLATGTPDALLAALLCKDASEDALPWEFCGSLLVASEDEYEEVRVAAVYALERVLLWPRSVHTDGDLWDGALAFARTCRVDSTLLSAMRTALQPVKGEHPLAALQPSTVKSAVVLLVDTLQDESWRVQRCALCALTSAATHSSSPLVHGEQLDGALEALRDTNAHVRAAAVCLAGVLRVASAPEAVAVLDALAAVCADGDEDAQDAAMRAACAFGRLNAALTVADGVQTVLPPERVHRCPTFVDHGAYVRAGAVLSALDELRCGRLSGVQSAGPDSQSTSAMGSSASDGSLSRAFAASMDTLGRADGASFGVNDAAAGCPTDGVPSVDVHPGQIMSNGDTTTDRPSLAGPAAHQSDISAALQPDKTDVARNDGAHAVDGFTKRAIAAETADLTEPGHVRRNSRADCQVAHPSAAHKDRTAEIEHAVQHATCVDPLYWSKVLPRLKDYRRMLAARYPPIVPLDASCFSRIGYDGEAVVLQMLRACDYAGAARVAAMLASTCQLHGVPRGSALLYGRVAETLLAGGLADMGDAVAGIVRAFAEGAGLEAPVRALICRGAPLTCRPTPLDVRFVDAPRGTLRGPLVSVTVQADVQPAVSRALSVCAVLSGGATCVVPATFDPDRGLHCAVVRVFVAEPATVSIAMQCDGTLLFGSPIVVRVE